MEMKSESEVAQSCPTLRDPMDCSLPGSSVHVIFQARVLEWGAIAFSMWKTLEEKGIPDHLTVSSESCIQVKKQQLEPYTEQLIGLKLRKEYEKAVYYCHPVYLTYMQSTSHEMLDWVKQRLESRFPGEILIAQIYR